jgi:Tfp pilus assembly protein PilX
MRTDNTQPKPKAAGRRGIASLLAMLFLILFSALALGFFATATMSAQVSRNERASSEAQLAAEGGLQFLRYQLGCVDISTSTSNATLLPAVAAELARLLNGTNNMGGQTIQIVNNAIAIPARPPGSAWTRPARASSAAP